MKTVTARNNMPVPVGIFKHLAYAPFSPESFKDLWESDDPIVWTSLVVNTYAPYSMLDSLVEKMFSLGLDGITANKTMPFINYFSDFYINIIRHPDAPSECLSYMVQEPFKGYVRSLAAFHKNTPIALVASSLYQEWSDHEDEPLWSGTWEDIEVNCDNYLRNLGWDKNTLDSTPIALKLKAIG